MINVRTLFDLTICEQKVSNESFYHKVSYSVQQWIINHFIIEEKANALTLCCFFFAGKKIKKKFYMFNILQEIKFSCQVFKRNLWKKEKAKILCYQSNPAFDGKDFQVWLS